MNPGLFVLGGGGRRRRLWCREDLFELLEAQGRREVFGAPSGDGALRLGRSGCPGGNSPDRRAQVFLAEAPDGTGAILGHIIVRVETDDDGAEYGLFSTTYVDPAARRRGVATGLLLCGEAWMSERGMPRAVTYTSPSNARLLQLYRKHGYNSREGSVVPLVVRAPSTCTKAQSTATPSVASNPEPDFPGSWWPSPRHRCPPRGPREIRPPGAGRPPPAPRDRPRPGGARSRDPEPFCGADRVDRAPRWR
jgi:GNAT superfamily N-acetyltransferase